MQRFVGVFGAGFRAFAVLMCLLGGFAVPAHATLLMASGDSQLFQFDLGAAVLPLVSVPFGLVGSSTVALSAYSDFSGILTTDFSLGVQSSTFVASFSQPDLDGMFALRITLISGAPVDLGRGMAIAINAFGLPVSATPVAVPEPTMLGLIGLGLLGLALTRYRRVH